MGSDSPHMKIKILIGSKLKGSSPCFLGPLKGRVIKHFKPLPYLGFSITYWCIIIWENLSPLKEEEDSMTHCLGSSHLGPLAPIDHNVATVGDTRVKDPTRHRWISFSWLTRWESIKVNKLIEWNQESELAFWIWRAQKSTISTNGLTRSWLWRQGVETQSQVAHDDDDEHGTYLLLCGF